MKVSVSKINNALNLFIDNEILPLSANMSGVEQFLFGTAVGVVRYKSQNVINNVLNSNFAKSLEIVDESGEVDIDTLYAASKAAMQKTKEIKIASIKLREPDLDKLYNYIIS